MDDPADSPANTKRYRPAPAKTFQCRGYGECRMVFSRSEHLARHIRKHTGERPFTCHCGKQFSRLDNLRQHAQTVHADKHEQNDRMMRDLTSLHASMAAANKVGTARTKRPAQHTTTSSSTAEAESPPTLLKQEPLPHSLIPFHQRPGTTAGYEGADPRDPRDGRDYHHTGGERMDAADDEDPRDSRGGHSFRGPQSFLAPPDAPYNAAPQSFLTFASPFGFGLPPRTSGSSRPPTANAGASAGPPDAGPPHAAGPGAGAGPGAEPDAHARTLPPLSVVVSASLPPAPGGPGSAVPGRPSHSRGGRAELGQYEQQHQHGYEREREYGQHLQHHPHPQQPLFVPQHAGGRRPSTATRPGTAPAAYYSHAAQRGYQHQHQHQHPFGGARAPWDGDGMGATLPGSRAREVGFATRSGAGGAGAQRLGSGRAGGSDEGSEGSGQAYDAEPPSPSGNTYDSPFSFNPPAIADASVSVSAPGGPGVPSLVSASAGANTAATAGTSPNPRKRPFPGDDGARREYAFGYGGRPGSGGGQYGNGEYGYGGSLGVPGYGSGHSIPGYGHGFTHGSGPAVSGFGLSGHGHSGYGYGFAGNEHAGDGNGSGGDGFAGHGDGHGDGRDASDGNAGNVEHANANGGNGHAAYAGNGGGPGYAGNEHGYAAYAGNGHGYGYGHGAGAGGGHGAGNGGSAPAPAPAAEYDYGLESRPQSRRLSVLELCNDDGFAGFGGGAGAASRPGTSSGLVSSASNLALFDRPVGGSAGAIPTANTGGDSYAGGTRIATPNSSSDGGNTVLAGSASPAASSAARSPADLRAGAKGRGAGGISPATRRDISTAGFVPSSATAASPALSSSTAARSPSAGYVAAPSLASPASSAPASPAVSATSSPAFAHAAAAAGVFSGYRGAFSPSPLSSDASHSPRWHTGTGGPYTVSSGTNVHSSARGILGLHPHSQSPSPVASDASAANVHRRGAESPHDQIRISVASPHSPAPVGMRA